MVGRRTASEKQKPPSFLLWPTRGLQLVDKADVIRATGSGGRGVVLRSIECMCVVSCSGCLCHAAPRPGHSRAWKPLGVRAIPEAAGALPGALFYLAPHSFFFSTPRSPLWRHCQRLTSPPACCTSNSIKSWTTHTWKMLRRRGISSRRRQFAPTTPRLFAKTTPGKNLTGQETLGTRKDANISSPCQSPSECGSHDIAYCT